jgi:FixJ family two-component response regulator
MIYVIDDDLSVRRALARLMASADLRAKTFASGEEFLASEDPGRADCLVMDIHLGGMTGLQLQERLAAMGSNTPIIFITAFDDDATRIRAQQAGAQAYFGKPFDDQALLDAIEISIRGAKTKALSSRI